jgi:cobalt-zinc-cadmium efflux system protein
MGHDHAHHHGHHHGADAADARALTLTLGMVLLVLVAEVAGGLLSGSLALLSDAAHMFTDAAALAIALTALRIGKRPPDDKRSFGYHRFEILAALANALLLMVAAAYILYEAWRRLREPAQIESALMLWIAVLGLAVNLASMRLLARGHEHNLNLKGAYLEVWSDMLGSVGVIGGALVIRFTGWTWVDSAVAVAIGLWVLPRTWQLLRASLHVLLEGVPEGVDLAEIEQALRRCEGVVGVHDLHVWSIASGRMSLSVHVVVAPPLPPGDALLTGLRTLLAERFGIHHSTVQLEQAPCEQERAEHGFGPAL